jgi:hypothetical protein
MFDATQKAVALDFARTLAARDYARAYTMLSASLRSELTAGAMQERFELMIPLDFGDVAPIEIVSDPSWDAMFVYVSLGGPIYSEAIIVSAFAEENGRQTIDAVEFGRP